MISPLEWDSGFFETKVGSVKINAIDDLDPSALRDYELVYIYLKERPRTEMDHPVLQQALFVDEKITYHKLLHTAAHTHTEVVSVLPATKPSGALIDLACEAGKFSRFKTDPLIPDIKFKSLYKAWLTNSIERKLAEEVFVYLHEGVEAGLITLGVKNDIPDIGLISVNAHFRVQGVGTKLLNAGESWARNVKNKNQIQVLTQGFNKPACLFYEKNGFQKVDTEYVYHWRNKYDDIHTI